MNNTILKYVDILGDYSFSELPFNEIDALILSLISYIDFTKIKNTKISIGEAQKLLEKKFPLKAKDKFNANVKTLFLKLANSKRFKNLQLENYQKKNTKEEQFGAITIRIDKHTIFISFEGTEDNLIGWEEDFRLSYLFPIPAQKSAMLYLKENIKLNDWHVFIGGHSKGGNLSMAALIEANFLNRLKIKQVYNFDGPGLLENEINSKKFRRVSKKITTYIPEESIVGILLNNPTYTKVIKSNSKKVQQHDAFTWECLGTIFYPGELSKYSQTFSKKIQKIITKYSLEERKLFVDTFFKLLYNAGYSTKSELNKLEFNKIKKIIVEMQRLKKEEKDIIIEILKIFIKKENKDEKNSHN